MATVLLVIHIMIAVALIGFILMQRSEGGGLGMGSGSGFMTGRGTTNFLTRTTAFLAAAFFATSLLLTLLAQFGGGERSLLDTKPTAPATTTTTPAPASTTAPPAPAPTTSPTQKP
jgi:preprotein translocase subunit SecG